MTSSGTYLTGLDEFLEREHSENGLLGVRLFAQNSDDFTEGDYARSVCDTMKVLQGCDTVKALETHFNKVIEIVPE